MIRKGLVIVTAAAAIAILAVSTLPPGQSGVSRARLATSLARRASSLPAPATSVRPPPPLARPGIIGAGLNIQLTPAQATQAADRCAAWASKAGFANNGRNGHLVTAVAIGMAESGCDASACFDDTTGTACTPSAVGRQGDSVDRGVWQINSLYWKNVGNQCAFSGLCNARSAYSLVSEYGTYFKPWTTYLTGTYKRYLPDARAAVEALRNGALTSAYIGSCAAYPADHRGAKVRLADCGGTTRTQLWRRADGQLRTGRGLCLGTRFRHSGPVTLQRCSRRWRQQWRARPGFTLYNKGARRCLTDPGGSIAPGHALALGPCRRSKTRAWYLP